MPSHVPSEMPESALYDRRYYEILREGGRRSAEAALPRVFELAAPRSIIDFGCGDGTWLAVAIRLGATDVLGVDGAWVPTDALQIPPSRFRAVDLAAPLDLGRRFDLAFCLEVAEHLPSSAAPVLVRTLTSHAPLILFSAAIPFQGGEDHVNECWPSGWRSLFESQGFACLDVLRGAIWEDPSVETWFRQNLLLFVHSAHIAAHPELAAAGPLPLDIVHPAMFLEAAAESVRRARDVDRLSQAYDVQSKEVSALEVENERLRAAWSALDRQLADVRQSFGWRLATRLRALGRRLRG